MLEQKITTREEYKEATRNLGYSVMANAKSRVERFVRSQDTWWDMREAIRLDHLYTTTSVLDHLNAKMPYFAHVSMIDKELVAYTPDRESGEQDRQVRVSIGRLLQKMYPAISQNAMRNLIETHNSEAIVNVEFLSGEAIRDVYLMENGVGSCMAGERNWSKEQHPTLAYDAPGIRLAVLRKASGDISARCLVYESATGEKTRVRNYGAPALDKALNLMGYKLGGLSGAILRKVVADETKPYQFRLPYLDYAGGMTNSEHCSIALLDGEIKVLTPDQRGKLVNAGAMIYVAGSGGTTTLTPVDTSSFNVVDVLTGAAISKLTDTTHRVWHEGKEGLTLSIPDEGDYMLVENLWVKSEETILIQSHRYINEAKRLADHGFHKLDPELYPDQQDRWLHTHEVFVDFEMNRTYLRKDCAILISVDNVITYRHVSKIDKKKQIKLSGLCDGKVIYAEPGADVKRTVKGAKVHAKTHEIVTMFNGDLDYKRGKRMVNVFSVGYYYDPKVHSTKEVYTKVGVQALYKRAEVEEGTPVYGQEREAMVYAIYQQLRNLSTAGISGYDDNLPPELKSARGFKGTYTYNSYNQRIIDLSNRQLLAYYTGIMYPQSYPEIANVIFTVVGRWIAEEEAVEAPHHLVTPDDVLPDPVIQILPTVDIAAVETLVSSGLLDPVMTEGRQVESAADLVAAVTPPEALPYVPLVRPVTEASAA